MKNKKYLLRFFVAIFSVMMLICQLNITYADESHSSSTVTMVYNPSVEVKYVDENGKELIESRKIEGEEGKEFEVKAESISGYVLKETKGNAKGIFGKDFEVTFVYRQNNTSNSGSNNSGVVNNNGNSTAGNQNNSTNKSLIPDSNQIMDGVKTGDYYADILVAVITGIIFGVAGMFLRKRKNITGK